MVNSYLEAKTLYLNYDENIKRLFKPFYPMKKIAICGASGSGKTTLAKKLSEITNIPFVNFSQNELMKEAPERLIKPLKEMTYEKYEPGISHEKIIRLSHRYPKFGLAFQKTILELRAEKASNYESMITDRSPIDSWVYFLLEASYGVSVNESHDFLKKCIKTFLLFDGLIFVHINPNNEIKDDKVRITNPYFQQFIQSSFRDTIERYFSFKPILTLNEWNFEKRMQDASIFIR